MASTEASTIASHAQAIPDVTKQPPTEENSAHSRRLRHDALATRVHQCEPFSISTNTANRENYGESPAMVAALTSCSPAAVSSNSGQKLPSSDWSVIHYTDSAGTARIAASPVFVMFMYPKLTPVPVTFCKGIS